MINSWSSFQNEITNGNSYDFGNFDHCMKMHQVIQGGGAHGTEVNGQYCMVQFYSKSNQTIPHTPKRSVFNYGWKSLDTRFGGAICIPSICVASETVADLMDTIFNGTDYVLATDYNQNDYCKSSSMENSTSLNIFGCLTAAILTLVTLCTVYDVRSRKHEKRSRNQVFLAFSLYKNASNLFSLKQKQSLDTIECLYGIRGISIISIIFLHSYYHRAMFPVQQPEQLTNLVERGYGRLIRGVSVSVDSFFLMSGLLVTRSILKDLDS